MRNNSIVKSIFMLILLLSAHTAGAKDDVQHEYAPGREKAIPHVSGDNEFSNTYQFWKDKESIQKAVKDGLMSHQINFKDFRWSEKSLDGEMVLDEGLEYFNQQNADGKSCASCHGIDGEKLKGVYKNFPKNNERINRIVTGPSQIEVCASERLGRKDWGPDTRPNTLAAFYIASLSDGEQIDVDVSKEPMKSSYERGKDLFFKRAGHFHYACASCHTPPTVGKYLRTQRPTTFYGDATQYPIYHFPYQLKGDDHSYVFTMQHQIRSCQSLSRMYQGKEGSPSMTDLEVFIRASSNGHEISIPVAEYNLNTEYLEHKLKKAE